MAAASLPSLLQHTTLVDHEEVLKAANQALKKSNSDIAAQHARTVALLKLDRHDDALRSLEESGGQLKARASFEHAYALYKTGRLQDALKVTKGAKPSQELMHLEAQIAYRMEDFARAAELYKTLASHVRSGDGEESDLRINSAATDAQLAWAGQRHLVGKVKPTREDLEQFETAFNAACGYISRGELKQAELLLGRAKELCNAADELSEDDKKAELLPIETQRAYVLSRLGKMEEACKVCEGLDITAIIDPATRHVARVNALGTSTNPNPYIAQRLFQSTSAFPARDRPFSFQTAILDYDSLAVDLQAKKFTGVASAAEALSSSSLSSHATSTAWFGVFTAAAAAKDQRGVAALNRIAQGLEGQSWSEVPIIRKHPSSVGLVLAMVQLYVAAGDTIHATSLLENLLSRLEASSSSADQDLRFAPGLVSAVTSWYAQNRRFGPAKAELAKAAQHWRQKSKGGQYGQLLEAAGAALLENASREDAQAAREIFESLEDEMHHTVTIAAGLVASAPIDSNVPPASINELPSIQKLTSGIDASALESAGVASLAPRASTAQTGAKRPADTEAKPTKPKKIRKSRMPKDFDENKKSDPERWLPLRDRSSWRPKGKKKGKGGGGGGGGGGGTQGGVVNDDGPATQAQGPKSTVVSGSGGPPKSSSKKKKGKNK